MVELVQLEFKVISETFEWKPENSLKNYGLERHDSGRAGRENENEFPNYSVHRKRAGRSEGLHTSNNCQNSGS